MKKEKITIKKLFKDSLNFINESKKEIFIGISFFIFFFIFGFFVSPPEEIKLQIFEMINELFLRFEGLNLFQTIWEIFSNNITIAFFSIIFGFFIGIFPIIIAMGNGYLVGFIARTVSEENGIWILWRLLPHGIFELPAIFIAIGLGIKIGFSVFKKETLKTNFKKAMQSFLMIIFILLLVAAVIEGLLIFLV